MFVATLVFVFLHWLLHFGGVNYFKKIVQCFWTSWRQPSAFPPLEQHCSGLDLFSSLLVHSHHSGISLHRVLGIPLSLLMEAHALLIFCWCSCFGGRLSPVAFWHRMLGRQTFWDHAWLKLIDGFAGYRVLYWNSFLFINSKIAPLPSCFHVTVLEFRSYSHFSFVCNFFPLPSLEACRSFKICPSLLKCHDGIPCVGWFSSTALHIHRVPSF